MSERRPSDDFEPLFGTGADLAAVALAAYAIIVTLRSGVPMAPPAEYPLKVAERLFSWATVVLLFGPWMMLIRRAQERELLPVDFLFVSDYAFLFWGIILFLAGFIFLAFPGLLS